MVSLEKGAPLFELRDLAHRGTVPLSQAASAHGAHRRSHRRRRRFRRPRQRAAGATGRHAHRRRAAEGFGSQAPTTVDPGDLSRGEIRAFRRRDGQPVYGIYYAPRSAHFRGPRGTAPPALVLVHGGPTSMTDAGLKMRDPVLDQPRLRRARRQLRRQHRLRPRLPRAARRPMGHRRRGRLRRRRAPPGRGGEVDGGRIAIPGGSAGGYTTLMALGHHATSSRPAAATTASADLGAAARDTHKFESRYLRPPDRHRARRRKDLSPTRSPINLIDGITAPVILFQGLDDKVVPPEQSRMIVDKLRARGIDVAYTSSPARRTAFARPKPSSPSSRPSSPSSAACCGSSLTPARSGRKPIALN